MNEIDYIPRRAAMEKLGIKSWAGIKAFEKKHKVSPIALINRHFGYRLSEIRQALGENVENKTTFILRPDWKYEK